MVCHAAANNCPSGKTTRRPGWWYTYPSEKYESQLGLWFPIYGKIKNVPNHQPVKCCGLLKKHYSFIWFHDWLIGFRILIGHGCHGAWDFWSISSNIFSHHSSHPRTWLMFALFCWVHFSAGSLPPTLWLEHCLELREKSFVFGDGEKPQVRGWKIHHE